MAVKDALYNHLVNNTGVTDLIGTRLYPQTAPSSASLPYATFSKISNQHVRHMGASSGLARPTFQIDVFGNTDLEADNVVEAIRDALDGYNGTLGASGQTVNDAVVFLESETDLFVNPVHGDEVGTHRVTMEFTIWHRESIPSLA